MRIVLDTNVVFSALLWRGTPYRLLEAIHQRSDVQLYSSTALLTELADVLTRPAAVKRLALIGRSAREALADYVEAVELVEPTRVRYPPMTIRPSPRPWLLSALSCRRGTYRFRR